MSNLSENIELPRGFSLEQYENGFAAKFPKELLGSFKEHFKGAKWRPNLVSWLIGSRSKKKFELWAMELADEALKIENAHELNSEEAVADFLKKLQLEKVDILIQKIDGFLLKEYHQTYDDHNELRENLEKLKLSQESLEVRLKKTVEVNKLIKEKSEELDCLAKEQAKLKSEYLALEQENIAKVEKALDMDAVKQAYHTITSLFGKIGSSLRVEFQQAQNVLEREQEKLHSIGLHSKGLELFIKMNMNRPDRDKLPMFNSIFVLSNYVENED